MEQGVRLRIFARDPDRARAFYARVFGWSLADDGRRRCWVITSGDDPRLGTDGPGAIGADHPGEVFIPPSTLRMSPPRPPPLPLAARSRASPLPGVG